MNKVKIYETKMMIPTYDVGGDEKNPMFFEKRVYQGSSGKVYPNPVREKIYDDKHDEEYNVVVLENDYLYVVVMPSLGGRIYTAYDKTNGYDFAYHNKVIKPALVGLLGPWVSGGIEFNWPQHHRPSTFMPLNSKIVNNDDGSASVFVGEIENMFSLKGMTEIKLYPDKAYIEINAQIYNRSDLPQTFLWWANPAVKVNDYTKTIMPPDVTAVMDHGKRAVSTFPIATGEYYKFDYSKGIDISQYKNIQVPTSFMAYKSNFDFVGGYDFNINAGIYHFADHHVSPGKKQWTWGCGDFGQAWDRNLTDENGPYVELMTGCFTDNQPDFTYVLPQEEKTFTQYFMPYKNVGAIKQANKDFCLNIVDGKLIIYSTGKFDDVNIKVLDGDKVVTEQTHCFEPTSSFEIENVKDNFTIELNYKGDKLRYNESMVEKFPIPDPASAIPQPQDVKTIEELYLYGLHIEQYRHATRLPEDYYLEGLKRDDTDLRINNAYGELLLRRGCFEESKKYFNKAIEKATIKNPNPANCQPYFNLGIAQLYTDDYDGAYDNFYKCIWTNDNKSGAFYYLAAIDYVRQDWTKACAHINSSIQYNSHNIKAQNLKGLILVELGKKDMAIAQFKLVQSIDTLDILSVYELNKLGVCDCINHAIRALTSYEATNIVCDFFIIKQYEKAEEFLSFFISKSENINWMPIYYLAYAKHKQGKEMVALDESKKYLDKVCFASRLFDILVLCDNIKANPDDYFASYQEGNLFYDKKQYETAYKLWSLSEKANDKFPQVKRNLALYFYNKAKKFDIAVDKLEEAFALDKTDSRILMELYQLYKIINKDNEFLYNFLNDNLEVASQRDDVYLEYINLVNDRDCVKAQELIMNRKFHPWEGGEGKVTKLYKKIKISMCNKYISEGDINTGIVLLNEALSFPHNLGEGKLVLDTMNDIYYNLGLAYEKKGDSENANKYFELATKGDRLVAADMYYNDAPVEYKYYMALALNKLGRNTEAQEIKQSFIDYADKNENKKVIIDYFAVSLPDMLIWEQDLDKNNNEFCAMLRQLSKDM